MSNEICKCIISQEHTETRRGQVTRQFAYSIACPKTLILSTKIINTWYVTTFLFKQQTILRVILFKFLWDLKLKWDGCNVSFRTLVCVHIWRTVCNGVWFLWHLRFYVLVKNLHPGASGKSTYFVGKKEIQILKVTLIMKVNVFVCSLI